jgi:hypothetical protein
MFREENSMALWKNTIEADFAKRPTFQNNTIAMLVRKLGHNVPVPVFLKVVTKLMYKKLPV